MARRLTVGFATDGQSGEGEPHRGGRAAGTVADKGSIQATFHWSPEARLTEFADDQRLSFPVQTAQTQPDQVSDTHSRVYATSTQPSRHSSSTDQLQHFETQADFTRVTAETAQNDTGTPTR